MINSPIALILAGVVIAAVLLLVPPAATPTTPEYAMLKGRRIVALEGHGLRCVFFFNTEGGIGVDGSAAVSCIEPLGFGKGKRHYGQWRTPQYERD